MNSNFDLYEIDAQIRQILDDGFVVDEETGELIGDLSDLDTLVLARETIIEDTALYFKAMKAKVAEFKAEEAELKKRRERIERYSEVLRMRIYDALQGSKFETPRVVVSFRKTQSVEITDADALLSWAQENNPDLLRVKPPEPDKTAIKKLLVADQIVPGAALASKSSMTIK